MINRFDVSSDDAQQGIREDPDYCPVALCLHRNGFPRASVGSRYVVFPVSETDHVTTGLPYSAQKHIRRFDRGGSMQEFVFEIDIPQQVIEWEKKRPKVLG